MGKILNEDTGFKVSIKTLIAIAVGITTVVSFWFAFQADLDDIKDEVEVAKTLPEPTALTIPEQCATSASPILVAAGIVYLLNHNSHPSYYKLLSMYY